MGKEAMVVATAVLSRAWVSVMAMLSAYLITPYDTSAASSSIFRAFATWDGVYYVDMAADGYGYENTHAFFPLFGLLTRYASALLAPFCDPQTAILVAGWCIRLTHLDDSNLSFVLAARYLYRLGQLLLQNETLARRSAIFFCFCPSGIFMSSCYSESLMCVLSFGGMYYLELYRTSHRSSTLHLVLSAILFGLSSATRSNGVLLSLYIAYYRLLASPSPLQALGAFLRYWVLTALLGVVAIGPQLLYFAFGIAAYCPSLSPYTATVASLLGVTSKLDVDRPWCASVVPNVSAMYMFIQKEYWGVGPFAYYQLKQIPNFALATPMLLLSSYALLSYYRPRATVVLPAPLQPYMVHLAFLLANALVVLHIQVLTRFLCANPPIFWAAGHLSMTHPTASKGLLLYALVFSVLGAVLFPSFYPWT